jgi:hypothetical protein
MANEFYYSVCLRIVHPTADPKSITEVITSLHPKIHSKAGSERRAKDGTPIVPNRKAALSHWLAELHDEEKLFSGDKPMSDFILGQLDKLEAYRSLFAQLREEGEVGLVIGWFSESNHSAGVLSAETLRKCGDLGIDLELNYYAPLTP